MRENRNPIAFAALLVFLSVQISGCAGGALAGVAGGVGKAALGAGKLALGAAKGAGRVALGAGKVALGAGRFALQNAGAAPGILNTVAQATGSPGVALARDITSVSVGGAQQIAQGIRGNRFASYKAAPSLSGLGSSCSGGSCPSGSCPSGSCPGGSCPSGVCPGGVCPGGSCPSGVCPDGVCSGGSCPAGPGFGSGGSSLNGGDVELN